MCSAVIVCKLPGSYSKTNTKNLSISKSYRLTYIFKVAHFCKLKNKNEHSNLIPYQVENNNIKKISDGIKSSSICQHVMFVFLDHYILFQRETLVNLKDSVAHAGIVLLLKPHTEDRPRRRVLTLFLIVV